MLHGGLKTVAIVLILFSLGRVGAQATPTMPSGQLSVTVAAFKGQVQVHDGDQAPWRRPHIGEQLAGQAEFRTGVSSWVHLHLPPKQRITLDRLGATKVLEAVYDQSSNKVKTDLGMKYGRTRYDVEKAEIEHESTIHTPGNTLAVRGTLTFVSNRPPFAPAVAIYGGPV